MSTQHPKYIRVAGVVYKLAVEQTDQQSKVEDSDLFFRLLRAVNDLSHNIKITEANLRRAKTPEQKARHETVLQAYRDSLDAVLARLPAGFGFVKQN